MTARSAGRTAPVACTTFRRPEALSESPSGRGPGTGPGTTRLSDFLQRQRHDVGDDHPLLKAGPVFHAHQDDVIEQQQVAQVRDLSDRTTEEALGGRLRPHLRVAASPKTSVFFSLKLC